MTAEMTTVIGQLNLTGGNWRNDAPNQVAVREPKSAGAPGAGKGDLFVLVEVCGANTDYTTLEQKLAGLIRDAYYLNRGSITASLRGALQAAGDQLYQRNHQVEVEERVVAGVVALVMSGEDAFAAQLGPAALFAVLGDHIQRYPTQSAWLDEKPAPKKGKIDADTETDSALGLRAVVEPNLYHLRVSPQDVLLLADSRLTGQLSLEQVVKATDSDNIKTIVKNLGSAIQSGDGSALALMVVAETPSAIGSLLKRATPSRHTLETDPAAITDASAHETVDEPGLAAQSLAMAGSLMRQPAHWLDGLTGKRSGSTDAAGEATREEKPVEVRVPAVPPPQAKAPRPAPLPLEPEEDEARVMASMARGSNFEPEIDHSPSLGGTLTRWLGLLILMPIMFLGRGVHALLGLFNRNPDEAPRVAGRHAHSNQSSAPAVSWALLRNIAIAIPLVVALIVAAIYWQQGRLREAEYQEFVTGAQNKFEQAQSADAASAMGLMSDAEALLAEAEKIKTEQPEIAEMRKKMDEQADVSGKVQRLFYLPQLRQYTDPGTNLKGLTVQGVEVYVLDIGTDRVFHHQLNDVGEALLPDNDTLLVASRGQTVDQTNVGEMVAMTWMPVGGNRQTSDLLILNSSGLLEYNSSWGITTSAIAKPDNVIAPTAVDSYFGNFYVLDPPANKLWRYLPTTDGYNVPPESYFAADSEVNLSNAVDVAIDGGVYILYKDGQIGKYEGGKPVSFNITGLDKPLSNPVAIYTAPNELVQHLYIADAGNQRIVQLNKDGSFVRQFKPREGEGVSFANLQDIFMDEIGERLYLLDSNNLYLANIPTQ